MRLHGEVTSKVRTVQKELNRSSTEQKILHVPRKRPFVSFKVGGIRSFVQAHPLEVLRYDRCCRKPCEELTAKRKRKSRPSSRLKSQSHC